MFGIFSFVCISYADNRDALLIKSVLHGLHRMQLSFYPQIPGVSSNSWEPGRCESYWFCFLITGWYSSPLTIPHDKLIVKEDTPVILGRETHESHEVLHQSLFC